MAPEIRRTGKVWTIEQSAGEGFVFAGGLVAEDSGYEPCDRVDDERGAKLATAQNKIANGNFVVNQMFRNPFVDSFVSAADEQDFVELAPPARRGLIEQTALRLEKCDLLIIALFRE